MIVENRIKKDPAHKSEVFHVTGRSRGLLSAGTFGSALYQITRQRITSFHPGGPHTRLRLPWRPQACNYLQPCWSNFLGMSKGEPLFFYGSVLKNKRLYPITKKMMWLVSQLCANLGKAGERSSAVRIFRGGGRMSRFATSSGLKS